MRLRLLLPAAALTAALPVAPANAATASVAAYGGTVTSTCDANTCTFVGNSAHCNDVGASCTAVLVAVAARVKVGSTTIRCEGSGTVTFTSKGRTTVVPVVVVTGPNITAGAFSGTRVNGTNDTVVTDGVMNTQCGTTFSVDENFAGRLAGTF